MSALLQRARLLREHRRHDEAVASLYQHLASEPQDAQGHVELALNRLEIPGQRKQAIDDIRRAIALQPDTSFYHALHAIILCRLDEEAQGLVAAEQAIAIDPENDTGWYAKGLALAGLKRWKEAEVALRQALELDPDSESASNLLSHVLRMQNRLDESEEETKRRLARDPENAFSFSNAGWAALQRHKVQEAENLFREALRLDPEFEYAKLGLKESFRARSAFYRMFLRWSFFMQRFSEKNQNFILVGIVLGFRVIRKAVAAIHPMLLIPLFFVFYVFLFGTWLATGIANLLILKDRIARLSLDRSEKVEGIVVGGGFLLGLCLGIGGLAAQLPVLALSGAVMMLTAIPTSMVFTNASKLGRVVFGSFAVLSYLLGAAGIVSFVSDPANDLMKDGIVALIGPLMLTMIATWIAMIPALRKRNPED